MSSPRIFAGFCPDEGCQAKLLFPSYETSIECTYCGQIHDSANVKDISEVKNLALGLQSVLRNLLTASNSGHKKGFEMVKVLGLSNYHCKLLSPLLTHYGMDKKTLKAKLLSELTDRLESTTFDCSILGERSFRIDLQHLNIPGYGRDLSGSTNYLAGTLARIKSTNSNRDTLIPIHADGDGHCLVHAVSRALVGRELFWHPLRTNLKQHILQYLDKYKALFQDFINASEWPGIIEECDPEYEPLDEEILGLRNIHVFVLGNILRRPIILLDSVAGMKSSGDYSAVFLPALVSPDHCRGKSGELNKPLCLAWSSSAHNHYIPLVGVKGGPLPLIHRSLLPKVWAVPQSLLTDYVEFNAVDCLVIGGDKSLQDSYIKKLTTAIDEVFVQKFGVHPTLVADVEHYKFRKQGIINMKPDAVLEATQKMLHERRLFRCLTCDACCVAPLAGEWLRPGNKGLLYNMAIKHFGHLREDKIYSFYNYGVTCSYDSKKDVLVLKENLLPVDKCTWCQDQNLRLIHYDGSVAYENGDATKARSPCTNGACPCGLKHWWAGNEYDDLPEMIPVKLTWAGKVVKETVPWFQFESDPKLNSNVFQVASYLVQKHFPGEFGSELLIQAVVAQILERTKHPEQKRSSLDCMARNESYDLENVEVSARPVEVSDTFGAAGKKLDHRKFFEEKFGSKPSTLTSSDMCKSGSTSTMVTDTPAASTTTVTETRPPTTSESPIAIQLPSNKDEMTKRAALTSVAETNPCVSTSLHANQDLGVEPTSNSEQAQGDNVQSKMHKVQLELRNQQKDYILRKEQEYNSQLQQRTARMLKNARPLQDPGGAYGKEKLPMLGRKAMGYDFQKREDSPKLSGQRTVRMGPGFSILTPPKPRRTTSSATADMLKRTENQLRSVNHQNSNVKTSSQILHLLQILERDDMLRFLNEPSTSNNPLYNLLASNRPSTSSVSGMSNARLAQPKAVADSDLSTPTSSSPNIQQTSTVVSQTPSNSAESLGLTQRVTKDDMSSPDSE